MKILIIAFFAICTTIIVDAQHHPKSGVVDNGKKVFCVYNSTSSTFEGVGKVSVAELEPAVALCDVLVYGWAGIDPTTNKLKSLKENLDLDQGQGLYRQVTNLKTKYPKLKVLLGVGGNSDPNQETYMQLLENPASFAVFINSAYSMIKSHNFDGLDLGWEFKPNKAKKIHSTAGAFWKGFKKTFGPSFVLDDKGEEHKAAYTNLVRQIKNAIRPDNYILALTVLPNQNTTIHYDVNNLAPNVDYVTLAAYDYQTFERNPEEADYPAPTYGLNERFPENNVDHQVNLWLQHGLPAQKLIVAIPTHARTWRLRTDSGSTAVPPVLEIKKPGQAGLQTNREGFLSYPEVCSLLPNANNAHLRGEYKPLVVQRDPAKRVGSYAYRLPDENGKFGLWVGYEDPDAAQNKAAYVANKHLGGVAIHNLENDDFRGSCSGEKYPILRAAKYRLAQS